MTAFDGDRARRWRTALTVAVGALLVAGVGALVARDSEDGTATGDRDRSSATSAGGRPASTTPPPPPRLVISHRRTRVMRGIDSLLTLNPRAELPTPEVLSLLPDGSDLRVEAGRVAAPREQVHRGLGRAVFGKLLTKYSPSLTGCSYGGCRSGYPQGLEIGIVTTGLDGGDERVLTSGGYQFGPVFSPDGKTILAQHNLAPTTRLADPRLALFDLDGKLLRTFEPHNPGADQGGGRFSPDGRSIAVVELLPNGRNAALVVVPIDGGASRQLAVGELFGPSWSNDGSSIAVIQSVREGEVAFGSDLWVFPVAGGPGRQVTSLTARRHPSYPARPSCISVTENPFPGISSPIWSPDDREIAFLSSHRHLDQFFYRYDVSIVSAQGGPVRTAYTAGPIACVRDASGDASGSLETDALALLDWA